MSQAAIETETEKEGRIAARRREGGEPPDTALAVRVTIAVTALT